MQISETADKGVHIFTLEGRIDTPSATKLDDVLQNAATSGKNKMILDMSEVKYISSSGLRTLADVLTKNQDAGGDLKLVGLNKKVLRVFQIIGFDNFFSMYDDVKTAIAAYQPAT